MIDTNAFHLAYLCVVGVFIGYFVFIRNIAILYTNMYYALEISLNMIILFSEHIVSYLHFSSAFQALPFEMLYDQLVLKDHCKRMYWLHLANRLSWLL